MKKIIFFFALIASINAKAQNNLDTMQVRSLTLQAQDWAYLASGISDGDSINNVALRLIRAKIKSNVPASWTTNVTVDIIPAIVVIKFYANTMSAAAAEIATRYTAIKNAISAKTNISYWIGLIDGSTSGDFDRKRNLGKNKLID